MYFLIYYIRRHRVFDCPTSSNWSVKLGDVSLIQPFRSSSLTFHPEASTTILFVWIHYFARNCKMMSSWCIIPPAFVTWDSFIKKNLPSSTLCLSWNTVLTSRINAWFFPLKYFQIIIWCSSNLQRRPVSTFLSVVRFCLLCFWASFQICGFHICLLHGIAVLFHCSHYPIFAYQESL